MSLKKDDRQNITSQASRTFEIKEGSVSTNVPPAETGESKDYFEQKIKAIEDKIQEVSRESIGVKESFDDLSISFAKLEKNIEKTSQFVNLVTFGALIIFTVATVSIILDYLNNNNKKYELLEERINCLDLKAEKLKK